MNWQEAIFYTALTIVPCVTLYSSFDACGVFRWVNNKLNGSK